MKVCSKCLIEKSKVAFLKNKSLCKQCHNTYMKEYYTRNPQKRKTHIGMAAKNKKVYQKTRREWIWRLKLKPCTDCNQTFHPYVMDFDHLPEYSKIDPISVLMSRTHSDEEILSEIAKYELVCSNCHRIRTIKRRTTEEDYQNWTTLST